MKKKKLEAIAVYKIGSISNLAVDQNDIRKCSAKYKYVFMEILKKICSLKFFPLFFLLTKYFLKKISVFWENSCVRMFVLQYFRNNWFPFN